LGLCRAPVAHGKAAVSGSVWWIAHWLRWLCWLTCSNANLLVIWYPEHTLTLLNPRKNTVHSCVCFIIHYVEINGTQHNKET
jgi:hypothetical protein